ncbi:solute carrier family 45, member 4 [Reticulomyxa filosa]|uniref:Solute carrier family 45, member 4 n=1 Tax=Reticulomyxa filosa TaxID=46433 RepID=X6NDE0_RETFI|nr:solute carrier family 45, member 4 [Reticulomyxa filosa]ETO24006.1 solute carrier family 45, member 4 [Reticulomyxa filosa]|eukprot:ETO06227.1 solute carrier family 45, member 4 [Reticulomyxa filosa]
MSTNLGSSSTLASSLDTSSTSQTNSATSAGAITLTSWRTAFLPSVGFFGVQLILAFESGDASAYLSELGLDERDLGYAWFAAPLVGLIIQPCIGAWSDRCESKFGRRRPFIAFFGILLFILCIIFSNAKYIGGLLGDNNNDRKFGLCIGLITLFLIDLVINCLEGPLRVLISDICDVDHQIQSNSFFGVQNGLAAACGYIYSNFMEYWCIYFIIMYYFYFMFCSRKSITDNT